MTPARTTTTAREYLRVSRDRSRRERSPNEQHLDHVEDAQRHGWTLGEPYRDIGSASRYARKDRAGFDRLVHDLERDVFGADVLILWEGSRGSRKVSEWANLIELCEERRVSIYVHTHGRMFDTQNAHDRYALQTDAAQSELASAETSDRATRAAKHDGKAGQPHGKIAFGYQRIYDSSTRRFISQEPHPEEAEVVREVFRRLLAGDPINALVRDLDARGVRSRSGKTLTPQHIRGMARNRTYVGDRVHIPGRFTKDPGLPVTTTGTWPALVSRADFLAVQAILDSPLRKTSRPGSGVHLLSMIGRCGVCQGVLTARSRRGKAAYRCDGHGHVIVPMTELDELAEDRILRYLARPSVFQAITDNDEKSAELDAARNEVLKVRAEWEDLTRLMESGDLTPALGARVEPAIVARLRLAEARERELNAPNPLAALISPGPGVRQRWEATAMANRRTLARHLLVPQWLGELRVNRSPGPNAAVRDRIEWHR